MTISELIEELEQYDDDTEVRLAIQPSYPFQHTIADVVEVDFSEGGEDEDDDEDDGETGTVVYIAEGGQLYSAPYLPGAASKELGWR